jgi:hypothetical protein
MSDQLHPLRNIGSTAVITSKIVTASTESCGLVCVGADGAIRSLRVTYPEEGPCSAALTSETRVGMPGQNFEAADVAEDGTVSAMSKS